MKVLRCPNCGGSRLDIEVRGSYAQVVCPECNTKGPQVYRVDEAIAQWNAAPRRVPGKPEDL